VTRVLIPFSGEGAGVGELSWGQQEIWQAIQRYGDSLSVGGVTPLPEGTSVQDVAATFGFLVGRHQSLRTRLAIDQDGHTLQVVADRGELELEVVDADPAGPGDPSDAAGPSGAADPSDTVDPAALAESVFARLLATNFDYENEWPVRLAVIQQGGAATHMVAVYCHYAIDQSGIEALIGDLANRDPETGLATRRVTAAPPLEQARQQNTAEGRRQSETALRYWERTLRSVPAHRFRDANARDAGQYAEANFTSTAVPAALTLINTRSRTGTAAILLAAYAVALARVTGRNPSVARVVVGNRFRPALADSVSTVNHPGLCVVDVAGAGFAEVVARAARGSMNAYKNAYYNPAARDELVAALGRERGEQIDLSCFFNDRRGPDPAFTVPTESDLTAQQINALARHSVLRWLPKPEAKTSERLFVHVEDAAGDAVLFRARAETNHLPESEIEALLRGVESVLLEAAADPDAPTGVA